MNPNCDSYQYRDLHGTGLCRDCPVENELGMAILTLGSSLAAILGLAFLVQASLQPKKELEGLQTLTVLRIFLAYLQINGLLAGLKVDWGASFRLVLSIQATIGGAGLNSLPMLQCVLGQEYWTAVPQTIVGLCLPLFVPVLTFLFQLIAMLFSLNKVVRAVDVPREILEQIGHFSSKKDGRKRKKIRSKKYGSGRRNRRKSQIDLNEQFFINAFYDHSKSALKEAYIWLSQRSETEWYVWADPESKAMDPPDKADMKMIAGKYVLPISPGDVDSLEKIQLEEAAESEKAELAALEQIKQAGGLKINGKKSDEKTETKSTATKLGAVVSQKEKSGTGTSIAQLGVVTQKVSTFKTANKMLLSSLGRARAKIDELLPQTKKKVKRTVKRAVEMGELSEAAGEALEQHLARLIVDHIDKLDSDDSEEEDDDDDSDCDSTSTSAGGAAYEKKMNKKQKRKSSHAATHLQRRESSFIVKNPVPNTSVAINKSCNPTGCCTAAALARVFCPGCGGKSEDGNCDAVCGNLRKAISLDLRSAVLHDMTKTLAFAGVVRKESGRLLDNMNSAKLVAGSKKPLFFDENAGNSRELKNFFDTVNDGYFTEEEEDDACSSTSNFLVPWLNQMSVFFSKK